MLISIALAAPRRRNGRNDDNDDDDDSSNGDYGVSGAGNRKGAADTGRNAGAQGKNGAKRNRRSSDDDKIIVKINRNGETVMQTGKGKAIFPKDFDFKSNNIIVDGKRVVFED